MNDYEKEQIYKRTRTKNAAVRVQEVLQGRGIHTRRRYQAGVILHLEVVSSGQTAFVVFGSAGTASLVLSASSAKDVSNARSYDIRKTDEFLALTDAIEEWCHRKPQTSM